MVKGTETRVNKENRVMLKNRRGFSFFVVQPADIFMNFAGVATQKRYLLYRFRTTEL